MMARFVKKRENERICSDHGKEGQPAIEANSTAISTHIRLGVSCTAMFVKLVFNVWKGDPKIKKQGVDLA
jgi:hypothetical protein